MTRLARALVLLLAANLLALVYVGGRIEAARQTVTQPSGPLAQADTLLDRLEQGIDVPVRLHIDDTALRAALPAPEPIHVQIVPELVMPPLRLPEIPAVRIPVELDLSAAVGEADALAGIVDRWRERTGR